MQSDFIYFMLLTWKTVSRWCPSHDWPLTTGRLCRVWEWSSHLLGAEKEGSTSQCELSDMYLQKYSGKNRTKGRNTFIHQTWSLPHQLTSPSITALFKKVLFVSSSGFLMDQTGFLSFRLLLKIAYIFFNHSDHVPKNNILISINFTLLEIDWSSISFL